ncbi:MAG TPA: carboxy terminal-processing peptidase, partial [Verrucomicrobiae bacterium]|nr:carboxy terminal-processing peptidase [Verrucomicrobiae bacterium]
WRLRVKFELLQDRLAFLDREAKKAEEKKKETSTPKGGEAIAKAEPAKYNPEETLKTISRRYNRLLHTMKDLTHEEVLQLYLNGLAHSYDPHSDYQNATEAEEFQIKSITLKLSGIGATLQADDGYTKIMHLVPGAPAAKSKQLKVGDKIVAVAQADAEPVDVVEMPLNKVVQLIRGTRGTEVRLTVQPADTTEAKKVVKITRDEIKIADSFAKARLVEHPDANGVPQKLGVIDLPQFYESCARDVERLIDRLKQENVTGIILDLRRNGGGILEEAVNLTGLFIPKGPVVQVKEKDPRRGNQVYSDQDNGKVAWDGPLIVLVSKLSASASEITAAALQDHGRALIVGDQTTHGKGTVQKLLPLNLYMNEEGAMDPGKLKLTVAKFYRIAGGTTQMIGVTPDVVLPSRYDYLELGEANLPNCLPADSTTPLPYLKQDRVRPYLAELRKSSASRIKSDRDFNYLNEDIELLKKQLQDKSISLNETKRLKERDEFKSRDEARKKERAARKPTSDKIYEITLAIIDQHKPLTLAKNGKTDDTNAADPAKADEEELDDDNSDAAKLDVYTTEALNILNDYREAILKAGGKLVTEKTAQANTTLK